MKVHTVNSQFPTSFYAFKVKLCMREGDGRLVNPGCGVSSQLMKERRKEKKPPGFTSLLR